MSAGIACERRECVHNLPGPSPTVLTLWDRLRQRTRALLLDDLLAAGGPEATLLDTMVLGSRSAIDPRLNDAFMRIGCTHYLAVSGSNIGMIAVFVFLVGRMLRLGVRGCAAAIVLVSVLYCLIAEPRPPIVRATIMSIAVCVGLVLGRPANFLNGLSLAALVIVAVRPTQLHDLDFQLSFSALLALVYLSPPLVSLARRWRPGVLPDPSDTPGELLARATPPTGWRRALGSLEAWFWWMLCASVAAWLASVPITLYYFDRFSLWGWLSTLVLFPFVFAVTVLSFAKLLVALLWPTLAAFLGIPLQWLTGLLIRVVEALEYLPALPVGFAAPPWWAAALVVVAVMAWTGRGQWPVARRLWPLTAGTAVLGLLCWLAPPQGDGRLRMTVLSVGRGAAIVFELPDGRCVICDAGTSGSFDPGATTMVPLLRQRGVRQVEAILISHPNLDHFSGVPTLLDGFPTGPLYLTPYFEPLSPRGEPGYALLADLEARRQPVRTIDSNTPPLAFGDVTVEVLWPPSDLGHQTAANETSLVVRVRYAGHAVLVTGDIEAMAQARLLGDARLRADVLVLPHHGSPRHNTRDFVQVVQPAVLISSTSARDTRTDPELASVLGKRAYFCTADAGAVTVTIDRAGVAASAFRGEQ